MTDDEMALVANQTAQLQAAQGLVHSPILGAGAFSLSPEELKVMRAEQQAVADLQHERYMAEERQRQTRELRASALHAALALMPGSADDLIRDARAIEAFLTGDTQAPKSH